MADLDRGAKIVLQTFPEDLLRLLFPDVEPGEPLSTEAVSAQILSDRAFAGHGSEGEVVLHLEFEAEPTSDVGHRVTRAACGLYFALGTPVRTTIIYLHPAANGRRPKRSYRLPIGVAHPRVQFHTLVLWEDVSADQIIASAQPGLLPFAGLAKGADLHQVRRAVRALEELKLPESERADLLVAFYLLSGYHFTSKELLAIMSEETLMQSKTYLHTLQRGREEGREEGRRSLLTELIQARLGPLPALDTRLAFATAADISALARLVAEAAPEEMLRAEIDRLPRAPQA